MSDEQKKEECSFIKLLAEVLLEILFGLFVSGIYFIITMGCFALIFPYLYLMYFCFKKISKKKKQQSERSVSD